MTSGYACNSSTVAIQYGCTTPHGRRAAPPNYKDIGADDIWWCRGWMIWSIGFSRQQGTSLKWSTFTVSRQMKTGCSNVACHLRQWIFGPNPTSVDDDEVDGPGTGGDQSLSTSEVVATLEISSRVSKQPQRARRPPAWTSHYDKSWTDSAN